MPATTPPRIDSTTRYDRQPDTEEHEDARDNDEAVRGEQHPLLVHLPEAEAVVGRR